MRPESYLPLGERGVLATAVDAAKPSRATTIVGTPNGGAVMGLGHPGVSLVGTAGVNVPVVQLGVLAWTTVFVIRYTGTETFFLTNSRVNAVPSYTMGRGRAYTLAGTSGRLWMGIDADSLFRGIETVKLYNDGRPHLAVGTFQGTSGVAIGSGNFQMWVDGARDNGVGADVGSATSPTNNSNPIRLNNPGATAVSVSHVAHFARRLSPAEILALWTAFRVGL